MDNPVPDRLEEVLLQRAIMQANRQKPKPQVATAAGEASPPILRSLAKFQRHNPWSRNVKVDEEQMMAPAAFSNLLASTPIQLPEEYLEKFPEQQGDVNRITFNPVMAAASDPNIDNTMAHELQHVLQTRTRSPAERFKEIQGPYAKQQDEIDAWAIGKEYSKERPNPQQYYDLAKLF